MYGKANKRLVLSFRQIDRFFTQNIVIVYVVKTFTHNVNTSMILNHLVVSLQKYLKPQ